MVDQTIYDPLDLVSHRHLVRDSDTVNEEARARLLFALLQGDTPVLSQTQGFDSQVVLDAATADDREGRYFRSLVSHGDIRIPLFNQPTLLDAFLSALDRPDFVFLCWPEIVGANPTAERGALRQRLVTKSDRADLPDALNRRAETVISLSAALEEVRFKTYAGQPAKTLSEVLQGIQASHVLEAPELQNAVGRMARLQRNSWGVCFAYLSKAPKRIQNPALDVLDYAYTAVLASSLGVTKWNVETVPEQNGLAIGRIAPGARRRVQWVVPNELAPPLRQVGWEDLLNFIEDVRHSRPTERERGAIEAQLLARTRVRETWFYRWIPRPIQVLATGTALAGAHLLLNTPANPATGVSGAIALGVTAALVQGLMTTSAREFSQCRDAIQHHLEHRLMSKYHGIIQRRRTP